MEINDAVLAIRANSDGDEYDIIAAIQEWANCQEAEVSEDGRIWIAGPHLGHWLTDAEAAAFVAWCDGHVRA